MSCSSSSHGSAIGCQVTNAFSAIHPESRCSPSANVRRLPYCQRDASQKGQEGAPGVALPGVVARPPAGTSPRRVLAMYRLVVLVVNTILLPLPGPLLLLIPFRLLGPNALRLNSIPTRLRFVGLSLLLGLLHSDGQ